MANIVKRGENSWRLTVNCGKDANGKYIRHTKTVKCRTKREAEVEYAKFKIEVETGQYIKPQRMTFAEFVNEWRDKYAADHLEERTIYTYESNLKLRILPTFGHLQMEDVTPMHITNYLKSLGKEGGRQDGKDGGLATGTIEYNHRILRNIFTRAVEWEVVKRNPAAPVRKPKVSYKDVLPYNENEVQVLMQSLEKEPFHWQVMIKLAIHTGLRRGELLALEWKHVDWEKVQINVLQSVSSTTAGVARVKEPKTKKSRRKVGLSEAMLELLREYQRYQSEERKAIEDWQGGEHLFIFAHPDGKAFHHERPYLWFRAFLKKNKLRYIRFHDLRHTAATLLINKGVHAKVISERLGHGNITTTMNIYGHALQEADKDAANKVSDILFIPSARKTKA
ncbi:site-specific integrase [Paenibacillus hemerocallicola]|uniref:Site-specific integrase n=1 Tax=Paenibacillus hemerocallicola TaxID=1172614 RepID=A0A5C4T620_9BACL|nr:site-specific integrase [Paenibacillus hemerocallicola]TNJ64534.1 site-specific integrase [Paenibacillus hemerocallicola]